MQIAVYRDSPKCHLDLKHPQQVLLCRLCFEQRDVGPVWWRSLVRLWTMEGETEDRIQAWLSTVYTASPKIWSAAAWGCYISSDNRRSALRFVKYFGCLSRACHSLPVKKSLKPQPSLRSKDQSFCFYIDRVNYRYRLIWTFLFLYNFGLIAAALKTCRNHNWGKVKLLKKPVCVGGLWDADFTVEPHTGSLIQQNILITSMINSHWKPPFPPASTFSLIVVHGSAALNPVYW